MYIFLCRFFPKTALFIENEKILKPLFINFYTGRYILVFMVFINAKISIFGRHKIGFVRNCGESTSYRPNFSLKSNKIFNYFCCFYYISNKIKPMRSQHLHCYHSYLSLVSLHTDLVKVSGQGGRYKMCVINHPKPWQSKY